MLKNVIELAAKRVAYSGTQLARIAWYSGHYAYGRRLMGPLTPPGQAPYAEEFGPLDRTRLRDTFRGLIKTEWHYIANGTYKLPLQNRQLSSPLRLWRESKDYLEDAARVAQRKADHAHDEVNQDDTYKDYPRYYRQNFHYQSDGWFSDESAQRYDMQVETLFTGAAGAMRRQALPIIKEIIGARAPSSLQMLDMGCGAASFLVDVKDNWPRLPVTALDLSPAYLGEAMKRLHGYRDVTFKKAAAEETELADARFDIITCVYLFHELPPKIRRQVASEIARLLKPGGYLVLVDSLQYGDEPGLDLLLENFPRGFHEPYYDSYCREDFPALFETAGLVPARQDVLAFMSKVSTLQKPIEQ